MSARVTNRSHVAKEAGKVEGICLAHPAITRYLDLLDEQREAIFHELEEAAVEDQRWMR
jgi:hypothetical protein